MAELVFTGVQPVKKGTGGDGKWFVIADSGNFSIDQDITANIWVVGGGCNGEKGEWLEDIGTALGAKGGDGGFVSYYTDIKISKDVNCYSDIALANDQSGTSLNVSGNTYYCNATGYTSTVGGSGSSITKGTTSNEYTINYQPGNGVTGVSTPYGYVGSSGGGGMACDGHNHRTKNGTGGSGAGNGGAHREEGSNAKNYGCGGGGGDGCGAIAKGNAGGAGMQGCIIVQYKIDENYIDPVDNPPPPTVEPPEPPVEFVPTPEEEKKFVIIRNYRRIITKHDIETNNAALSSSSCCCCTTDSGCGCNGGSSQTQNSGDSELSNLGSVRTDGLAEKTQALETENLALLKRIRELENK